MTAWARSAAVVVALGAGVVGLVGVTTGANQSGRDASRAPSLAALQSAPQAVGAPPPVLVAGAYWKRLTPAEKQAYVSGFLAGAAAEQVRAQAGGGRAGESTAASSVAVSALRASHTLRFPFGPAVYAAQMDDYYWWENHAEVPILDAMTEINARMMAQQEQGAPQR
jgi:hypothetical protein